MDRAGASPLRCRPLLSHRLFQTLFVAGAGCFRLGGIPRHAPPTARRFTLRRPGRIHPARAGATAAPGGDHAERLQLVGLHRPYAVSRFQQETGIRIRYDVYDSLETLEGKLSAGRSGYDIIVPTSEPTFARLARAGALLPLDRGRIPNWGNQDPALMQRVASSDPGNRFGAIYLYGTVGLGIRTDRVRAIAAGCAAG
jgi:hypothetical protein